MTEHPRAGEKRDLAMLEAVLEGLSLREIGDRNGRTASLVRIVVKRISRRISGVYYTGVHAMRADADRLRAMIRDVRQKRGTPS
jgi:hypothetical protein